jgi:hypothetical protein
MTSRNVTGLAAAVLIASALFYTRLFTVPAFGDESHFFATTVALSPFHIDKLATFRELSSPTLFIAFSSVVQAVGPSLPALRLIVFLSFGATLIVYRQLATEAARRAGLSSSAADVTFILLLTFPYLVICGVFFYTDLPAVLFGMLSYRSFERRQRVGAALWATLAIHCRQFMIFVPLSLACAEAWRWRSRPAELLRGVGPWAIPVISYAPYLILWRDVSPMRQIYPQLAALPFVQPTHVSYLLAAIGLYLWPLAAWLSWRRWSMSATVCAAAAAAWIVAAPPHANEFFVLIDVDITTLGLVDSALTRIDPGAFRTVVLAAGAAAGAVLHYELLARAPQASVLRWVIAVYWLMNLFSHLTWDKYLLPVLPFIYLAALAHPRARAWRWPGGAAAHSAVPSQASGGDGSHRDSLLQYSS